MKKLFKLFVTIFSIVLSIKIDLIASEVSSCYIGYTYDHKSACFFPYNQHCRITKIIIKNNSDTVIKYDRECDFSTSKPKQQTVALSNESSITYKTIYCSTNNCNVLSLFENEVIPKSLPLVNSCQISNFERGLSEWRNCSAPDNQYCYIMKLSYLNEDYDPIYKAGCAQACTNADNVIGDASEYTGVNGRGNVSLTSRCCTKNDCNGLKLFKRCRKIFYNILLLIIFNILYIFFSFKLFKFINIELKTL